MEGDELYASSALVRREKFTRCHHTYSSKPRTAQATSLRVKIVDDEDQNMYLTQSEKNDEPRRDNFAVHEEGIKSNSEFTHPQMPLSQSMLEQSGIIKKRNQAFKAHNVEKRASQKE
ncbi:hypothetical protein O181_024952 [Austropuccinia psidii MF-1]|uniref:Uncharacterized protein n=1 Tax=Austropuccinia psidii MF-1 TaxID=1389203 RepID=A0A9Q3CMI9_9BASI|nr:hypothetical protein [Austropuccinia psidii MF-1]